METLKKTLNIVITAALVVLIVWRLFSNKNGSQTELNRIKDTQWEIPVNVGTATYIDSEENFSVSGSFEAFNIVNVISGAEGIITNFHVKEGMRVEKDDLLASIENLTSLKNYNLSKQNYGKAKKDLNRFRNLKSQEAVSDADIEEVELAFQNAEADYYNAKELFEDNQIIAPVSGHITSAFADLGHHVVPGTPVFVIADIERIKMVVDLTGEQMLKINRGCKLTITCDLFPGRKFAGKLYSKELKANKSGRYTATILMKNEKSNPVLPGMTGKINFKTEEIQKFVIPRSAISGSMRSAEVFVVNNRRAIKKRISAVPYNSEYVEVLNGLDVRDSIVLGGQINLTDSARVKVICNNKNILK